MRVLVTGATGRVGSRLIPRLLAQGYDVRVLVRSEEQARSMRAAGAKPTVGDLLQPDTLTHAVAGVDGIVHLAAFFRGATEAAARATNLDGTLALARAAREAGVRKFVYVSTNLVYGPGRGRPAREDDEPKPEPDRFYPVSKLAAERELAALYQDRAADLCILRLAFVYGEGDPHLAEAVNLTRGQPPGKRMQLVHHADVAQAIMLSLRAAQSDMQIYNVADDLPVPISEIRRLNGRSELDDSTAGDVADPWEGIVDTAKIKRDLGFRPVYPSLHEAVSDGAL